MVYEFQGIFVLLSVGIKKPYKRMFRKLMFDSVVSINKQYNGTFSAIWRA